MKPWRPTKGEYVRILPDSACHESVWGMVGKIIRGPGDPCLHDGKAYDTCWAVEFPTPIPGRVGLDQLGGPNHPRENVYIFWREEMEFDPFLSACQQVLQEEEHD